MLPDLPKVWWVTGCRPNPPYGAIKGFVEMRLEQRPIRLLPAPRVRTQAQVLFVWADQPVGLALGVRHVGRDA